MADENKSNRPVNSSEKPVNKIYETTAESIERSLVAGLETAHQDVEENIRKKGIVNPQQQRMMRAQAHGAEKKKASRLLNTLASPSRIQSEVATLAHQEATRRNVSGSSLMGMSDYLLEQGYQEDMLRANEHRMKVANSVKTANISSGGSPQLSTAYREDLAAGGFYAQEAAKKKAAINERRRTGISDVKVESAIQETRDRRSVFTQDEALKRQISENKLSRKDLESQYESTYSKFEKMERGRGKLATRAEQIMAEKSLREQALNQTVEEQKMLHGGNKSAADIIKDSPALQAAQKEIEKLEKNLESVGKAAANADKELLGYNQELSKQERMLKSMPRGGVGGFMQGGGGDAIIEAMGTASQLYRSQMVGVPMREERAKAGIANLALSRYNRQFAATQGDMGAYYEILQDRGGAEAFGKQMELRGKISSGTEATLNVAEGLHGVLGVAMGSGDTSKSMAGIAKMFSKGTQAGAAAVRGVNENAVVGAETKLEAILTRDQYNAAVAAIRSQGGQALYNQAMGAANISVGSGNAAALEEKLSSISGMQDAVTRGNLSPEEYRQVTAQVGQSVYGANQDRADIAIRAGEMQKKRVMSTDQFTQAMGIQSAAGGSVGGLESTLKRAVAAGVNDSKLLVEFVQLSSNLNQSLTDMGTSAENHTAYSNKVQQMKEAGVSEVLATRSAASQIGAIDAMLRDTSINEGSILKAGVIQKALGPGATDLERMYLQKADTAQLSMLTKDTLTAEERQSLSPVQKSIRTKFEKDLQASQGYAAEMTNIAAMSAAGTLFMQGAPDAMQATQIMLNQRDTKERNIVNYNGKTSGADFKDQSGKAEERGQDQAQAALNQIVQAAKALGGVKETFSAITDSLKIITANLDSNKAATAAQTDAANLQANGVFKAATDKFAAAVDQMQTKMGITPAEKAAVDNTNKNPGLGFEKSKGSKTNNGLRWGSG